MGTIRNSAVAGGRARAEPPQTIPASAGRTKADELDSRLAQAREGGGPERVQRQHDKGKLTARERIRLLVDPGSFLEIDPLRRPCRPEIGQPSEVPGDGVVAGTASIDGRPVALCAQDFTVQGGSLGRAHADKVCKVLDHAIRNRCPVVQINDSGGARIQEGVASLAGYGDIFHRNVAASGLIPQVTIIAGPCAGGAVYSPALTDVVIQVRGTAHLFLTGPDVVETVTGEQVSFEELGGADVHGTKSGVVHLVADDEAQALDLAIEVLSYLPRSTHHPLPTTDGPETRAHPDPVLDHVVPANGQKPYPIEEVVRRIVDGGRLLELSPDFAPNLKTCLARIGGIPVGVVANDPSHLAGVLDIGASTKGARFVRFCDAFGLPLVTLVDVPGFLPGTDQEWNGIIRHGAKLVHAYSEASVPKLTLVLRKAYGGAYIAMCSKHLGADVNLAWPTAEIAVMGARGAVKVLHRRDLAEASDPDHLRQELEADYERAFATPYQAAAEGYVDAVIQARDTRPQLAAWLPRLMDKRRDPPTKPHGNPPL